MTSMGVYAIAEQGTDTYVAGLAKWPDTVGVPDGRLCAPMITDAALALRFHDRREAEAEAVKYRAENPGRNYVVVELAD